VRASYDVASHGWIARVGEQNLNEQRGDWEPDLRDEGLTRPFPTAAACLGNAVASIIATVDADATNTMERQRLHPLNDTMKPPQERRHE
jgi:hypothetical protein